MQSLFIPVVLGTSRKGRRSERAAHFVRDQLEAREAVETELVDVRDHVASPVTTPPWGAGGANESPTRWQEIAARADGFIFVLPEYNHGYPGEFKLLLDSLFHTEYAHKPAAVCGVSRGTFGGTRMIDLIKPVLVELKIVPIRETMYFSKIAEAFEEDGTPQAREQQESYFAKMFDELRWHAESLKAKRDA